MLNSNPESIPSIALTIAITNIHTGLPAESKPSNQNDDACHDSLGNRGNREYGPVGEQQIELVQRSGQDALHRSCCIVTEVDYEHHEKQEKAQQDQTGVVQQLRGSWMMWGHFRT
uniref:Uncharacterized protein MLC1351.19c n=1 Tax=Mycobacterium leprae TaxID=1769 RepID=O05680_MYCLR|nr:hypothetical protein MLC1351.19c [Mycobacterium leprae]